MRAWRNLFYMRAVEDFVTDIDFLKLYSPGILDVLEPDGLWDRVHVFRSAPGAGKTSLLRLFTPSSLLTLFSCKALEQYRDLYERLAALGALSDRGPEVAAPMLSCVHNYSSLEDMDIEIVQKDRLLFGLLNARIVLAVLRAISTLKGLRYPEDLNRLSVDYNLDSSLPVGVPNRGTGDTYFQWACEFEKKISLTIDSLLPRLEESLLGHDSLFSLGLFAHGSLRCDGVLVSEKIVVMLDDVQKLSRRQRGRLLALVIDSRAPTKTWVAERLESLSMDELLSPGNLEDRDWVEVNLEQYWQKYRKRFESFVRNVGDKRADSASDGQISSFEACLEEPTGLSGGKDILKQALTTVSGRVYALDPAHEYRAWIETREQFVGTDMERLLAWRVLEIIIQRDLLKGQKMLDLGEPTEDRLSSQAGSDVRAAAELFLAKEFSIPYYAGFSRLSWIASSNIEQFLRLSGEVFGEIVSAALLSFSKKMPRVGAVRQERIITSAVRQEWDGLTARVEHPNEVRNLIEAIGTFCRAETHRPNAPYAPGVTGIAITMSDRALLTSQKEGKEPFARLARTIATCISFNILEAEPDYKCKGQRWFLLYLNRMFCVKFDLPLQYGGWRERSLRVLFQWMESGFRGRQGDLL